MAGEFSAIKSRPDNCPALTSGQVAWTRPKSDSDSQHDLLPEFDRPHQSCFRDRRRRFAPSEQRRRSFYALMSPLLPGLPFETEAKVQAPEEINY